MTGFQSLLDASTLMNWSKNFIKLEKKTKGDVFWNGVIFQPLGKKRIYVKNEEYDVTPRIRK